MSSTAVEKNRCLCQTDFSCNNGKRSVLSNSTCHSFWWQNYKKSTEINIQISSNQKCIL